MGIINISTQWVKYLPFVLVGLGFVVAVFYVFKRDHLLKFVTDSLTTDGRPDSKKMSGFVLVVTIVLGFLVSIYYDKDHKPQEFYVFTIAGLIASFYGIREVSRYINGKYNGGGNGNGTDTGQANDPAAGQPENTEGK
jgi:undecaprenyl pyrophosphate phosphatase UppP